MKFLIDAQLPRRLARWLQTQGHDALHTLDLPTGNIANADLERLMADNLTAILSALNVNRFVELTRTGLVIHD